MFKCCYEKLPSFQSFSLPLSGVLQLNTSSIVAIPLYTAHGIGRVVGALGSEAGFAGSMLN